MTVREQRAPLLALGIVASAMVWATCGSSAQNLPGEDTVSCSDYIDNDEDGLADCRDPDCAGTPECQTETACGDGHDNDDDALPDCSDPDCTNAPYCLGADCGDGVCAAVEDAASCPEDCLVSPECGDGDLDLGEECDGLDLNGQNCAGLGWDSGQLACAVDCRFDAQGCFCDTAGMNCIQCGESQCTLQACDAQRATCNANAECITMEDCAKACGLDTACWGLCEQSHPGGVADFYELWSCIICDPGPCFDLCFGGSTCAAFP